jgi:hypothetical protein
MKDVDPRLRGRTDRFESRCKTGVEALAAAEIMVETARAIQERR